MFMANPYSETMGSLDQSLETVIGKMVGSLEIVGPKLFNPACWSLQMVDIPNEINK